MGLSLANNNEVLNAKIKICGLTRLEDITTVNQLQPDYIGFVFAPSRRQVSFEHAKQLKAALNPHIQSVGVFVNESIPMILSTVHEGILDVIQLHGEETEEYIKQLKCQTTIPIIKAISVQAKGDVEQWNESEADYLLLDHKGGGTGETFDWSLIGECRKPFFLAGGLGVNNINEALASVRPWAVDVSSGVETEGVKDAKKIEEFIHCVKVEA